MQKFLLLGFLLTQLQLDAQITGIGPFQINKASYKIVDSIAVSGKIKVQKAKGTRHIPYSVTGARKLTTIVILVPDSVDREKNTTDHTYWVPGVRSVYINYLKVEGQELKDIYLLFYQDVLISLTSEGSKDLEDHFKSKYGTPKVTHSSSSERCDNKDGTSSYVEEQSEWSEWDTRNRYIAAKMNFLIWYNTDCHKEYSRSFYLQNHQMVSDIDAQEIFSN